MAAKLTPEQLDAYWSRTSSLMWTILGLWFFFSFVIHFFAPTLNSVHILGFPMGTTKITKRDVMARFRDRLREAVHHSRLCEHVVGTGRARRRIRVGKCARIHEIKLREPHRFHCAGRCTDIAGMARFDKHDANIFQRRVCDHLK